MLFFARIIILKKKCASVKLGIISPNIAGCKFQKKQTLWSFTIKCCIPFLSLNCFHRSFLKKHGACKIFHSSIAEQISFVSKKCALNMSTANSRPEETWSNVQNPDMTFHEILIGSWRDPYNGLPSWELTYPFPKALSSRWFSFPQGGICDPSLEGIIIPI